MRAAAYGAPDGSTAAITAALDALRCGLVNGGRSYALMRGYAAFVLAAQDDPRAASAIDTLRRFLPKRLDTLMVASELAAQFGRMDEAKHAYGVAAEAYSARIEPLTALATPAEM